MSSATPPPTSGTIDVLFASEERLVRVRCNDGLGADLVRRCYLPYRIDEPDGRATGDYAFERHGTAWIVSGPDDSDPVKHDCAWNAVADIEYRVTLELLMGVPSRVHLHAAGLERRGSAVLAIGGSGAGKSTLAASWSMQGHRVLADDTLFLAEGGMAIGFKRLFKLSPIVIAGLGVDSSDTPFWEEGRDEIWFDPGERGGWSEPVPIGLVVLLDRTVRANPTVEDVSRREALNLLHASLMPSGLHGRAAFEGLLEAATKVRMVRCTYRDASDLFGSVADLLP